MTERDDWHTYLHKDFGHYDNMPKAHRDAMMSYLDILDTTVQTPENYDILYAVDYLLADHLDLDDDMTAIMLREAAENEGLLPSDDMFNDPETHRVATELLLLFPLRSDTITSMVDLTYNEQAATAWYYNVAVAILERTDAVHAECGQAAELRCEHSVQCPRRVVARLLEPAAQDRLELALVEDISDIKLHVAMELR